MTNSDYETGMYFDRDEAESAVDRLNGLGYTQNDISVVMDDKTREKAFASEVGAKTTEGVATGAVAGGLLGAIVAGVAATGSVFAVVGTGGVAAPLVIGPLAAALAGLGVGGAAGGILGGLIGLGIGEQRAKQYEQGLREGGILIAVRPKGEHTEKVREALRDRYTADYAGEVSARR
jgi:uncharacterized membrane protein